MVVLQVTGGGHAAIAQSSGLAHTLAHVNAKAATIAALGTRFNMSLSTRPGSAHSFVCPTRHRLQQMDSAPTGIMMVAAIACPWIRSMVTMTTVTGKQQRLTLLPL